MNGNTIRYKLRPCDCGNIISPWTKYGNLLSKSKYDQRKTCGRCKPKRPYVLKKIETDESREARARKLKLSRAEWYHVQPDIAERFICGRFRNLQEGGYQ